MDLLASQIAQLQEQARRQDATNEAQASSLSRLSSSSEAQAASIARLSSENRSLKTIAEGQDRVIGQLWRACFPSGFWVWEDAKEGREGGRWCWSNASRSSFRSARITSLLLPKTLYLSVVDAAPFIFSSLPNSSAFRPGSINIPVLALEDVSCSFQLGYWTPLLRLLNPSKLRLRGSNSDATLHYPFPPSITRVPGSTISSITEDWDHLEAVDCRGFGSVFLLLSTVEQPSTSSFAFTEPLRKHTRGPEPVKFKLFRKLSTERTTRERAAERELAALLEKPIDVEGEGSEFWLVATRRGSK